MYEAVRVSPVPGTRQAPMYRDEELGKLRPVGRAGQYSGVDIRVTSAGCFITNARAFAFFVLFP